MEKKNIRRSIYLSTDEYVKLKEKAQLNKQTFNEYVRTLIIKENESTASLVTNTNDIKDMVSEMMIRQEINQQSVMNYLSYILGIILCNTGKEKIQSAGYREFLEHYDDFLKLIQTEQIEKAIKIIDKNHQKNKDSFLTAEYKKLTEKN